MTKQPVAAEAVTDKNKGSDEGEAGGKGGSSGKGSPASGAAKSAAQAPAAAAATKARKKTNVKSVMVSLIYIHHSITQSLPLQMFKAIQFPGQVLQTAVIAVHVSRLLMLLVKLHKKQVKLS